MLLIFPNVTYFMDDNSAFRFIIYIVVFIHIKFSNIICNNSIILNTKSDIISFIIRIHFKHWNVTIIKSLSGSQI